MNNSDDIRLSHDQMNRFCNLIKKKVGLKLDKEKYRNRLCKAIKRRMQKLDISNPDEYYDEVWFSENSEREMNKLINSSVVNETLFYRNEPQMEVLEDKILPKLIEHRLKSDQTDLRILSAGCSNGPEPYSLAISFMEASRKQNLATDNLDLKIIGVDINTEALNNARAGEYPPRPVRNAPDRIRTRYFNSTDKGYEVKDSVKEKVSFQYLNLVDASPPKNQDIVFHRNVLIYFEEYIREKVVEKLHHCMKDDGLLILGHSENFKPYDDYFERTKWSELQIYRKWTTDRRTPSIWDRDSGTFRGDERRKSILSRDAPEVGEEISEDPDYQLITISGVIGDNINSNSFRSRIQQRLMPKRDNIVFDLMNVPYVSNTNLRNLKKVLRPLLKGDKKVYIISEDDQIKRWIRKTFSSPFIQVIESFPDKLKTSQSSGNLTKSTNTENTESPDRTIDTTSAHSHLEDLVNDNSILERKSPTDKRKSLDDLVTIEEGPHEIGIKIEGDLRADDDSTNHEALKNQLTSVLERVKEDSNINTATINLTEVDYIDREFALMFKRLQSLTADEKYSVKIVASDSSMINSLERWGCKLN